MKKIISFLIILMLAVLCSACINNYAVQQLNQKAKEFSDKGDLNSAASRLESSIDLDGSVFESRYNLAVVYIKLENCEKALEQIKEARNLQPSDNSLNYVEGLANTCLADKLIDKDVDIDEHEDDNNELSLGDAKNYINYLKNANSSFEKYLSQDKNDEVQLIIEKNNQLIDEYSNKYGI